MSKIGRRVSKVLLFCIYGFAAFVALAVCGIVYSYSRSKLDFTNLEDIYTAEKSVGFTPSSKMMYAEGVGLLDPTFFYKAQVDPEDINWLENAPEVAEFDAPGNAPLWWSLSFWKDTRSPGFKFHRTTSNWPSHFAYSEEARVIYGVVDLE